MNLDRTRATGLVVASAIFIVLGVYGLVFSALYSPTPIPLIVLSLVSIVAGAGALFSRRFALWLAMLLFPLGVVEAAATLWYSVTVFGWYPNNLVTAFNASLMLYVAGLVLSLLLVMDKRSQLK